MKADNEMLDTRFLFQPRGPHTAWLFRMPTPAILIGRTNPRTGRPYGKEIRESLGGLRDLKSAREERDRRLGEIRAEQLRAVEHANGSVEEALNIAVSLNDLNPEERDDIETLLVNDAEALEQRIARAETKKLGEERARELAEKKAVRWYRVATGKVTPFTAAYEQYKEDAGKTLSRSTLNNLNTAAKEFTDFAGADITMQEVNRRRVAEFVTEYLPSKKGPKAPEGQGPATIKKKVSQLAQVWRWAIKRGLLPYSKETPWDEQAPSAKEIASSKAQRRTFTPEETIKLFTAAPAGTALGDAIRVALMTGVRLEEVASLNASQVEVDARYYVIGKGKTENAPRTVPLVGPAREVIRVRLKAANGQGPLFPELPIRKSTGKRGGALSQAFTRLRRDVLGKHTDRELVQHCFRHTWRTAARRAGVDLRTAHELGGWSRGRETDVSYDHGLEVEAYERDQQKVADWFARQGYL